MSTTQDLAILNSVFNPLLPLGECPYDSISPADLKDEDNDTTEVQKAREIELQAVKAAERGEIENALSMFTQAIEIAPERPSGYNNRAQALRLKGDVSGALEDLNKSIDVSQGEGRSACLAYCQRALIHRLYGQDEKATEDFKKAAELGSDFAKSQLVLLNPYAALCNQMLSKVFAQCKAGYSE